MEKTWPRGLAPLSLLFFFFVFYFSLPLRPLSAEVGCIFLPTCNTVLCICVKKKKKKKEKEKKEEWLETSNQVSREEADPKHVH